MPTPRAPPLKCLKISSKPASVESLPRQKASRLLDPHFPFTFRRIEGCYHEFSRFNAMVIDPELVATWNDHDYQRNPSTKAMD